MTFEKLKEEFDDCTFEFTDEGTLQIFPPCNNRIKIGECYYYINIDGEVKNCPWNRDALDIRMHQFGNVFEDYNEALKVSNQLKAFHIMRKNGGREYIADSENYEIVINKDIKDLDVLCSNNYGCISHTLYFPCSAFARNAIKELKENELDKVLFGVGE